METYFFTELSLRNDSYQPLIKKYLDFLIQGDGRKAHCPFTKRTVSKKLYYYDVSHELLSAKEFETTLNTMKLFMNGQLDRSAVVAVVYANTENFSIETAMRVEEYRQQYRLEYISHGLTIAWTHPKNNTGTHTDKQKPDYPL